MSHSSVKKKSKRKGPASHHPAGDNGAARAHATPQASSSRLGAFYSAGPVFGLGLPVQAKVVVGRVNDPYEREADAVADRVASGAPQAPAISRISPGGLSGLVQRQEDEKEPVQTTLVQRQEAEEEPEETTPVQTFVQRQEAEEEPEETTPVQTFVQRQAEEEEPEEATPIQTFVQRQAEEEPEETPVQTFVQRQAEEEEEETPAQTFAQRQAEEEAEETPAQTFVQRQAEEEAEETPAQTFAQRQAEEEPEETPAQTFAQRQEAEEEPEEEEEPIQPKGEPDRASASPSLDSQLASTQSGGFPLPEGTRSQMETHFASDFGHVRLHTDHEAHHMTRQLHAQAFTSGHHIYFGAGRYNPANNTGQRLIAHELTHVVQQGASRGTRGTTAAQPTASTIVQRSWLGRAWGAVTGAVSGAIDFVSQGLEAGKRALMRHLRDFVREIPGYRLFTVVLGSDPISGDAVAKSGRNFIEAGLDVIPGGALLKRKLEQEGALGEAAAWLDEQIDLLDFSPSQIVAEFRRFWRELELGDLASPRRVFQSVQNIFRPPIRRLFRFARNVAVRLLQIVKDYVVSQVIGFVRQRTRAYPLLTVILGQDPISGETVQRTPMNLLRGFMQLSEDGAQKLRQMEETGTLQRAANWINRAVARLTRNLRAIRSGFTRIWSRVTIQNLMHPIRTFQEIYRTFAGPVGDIISFLIEVGVQVLRFIKDALLRRLAAYARTVRGYPLLTVILGRDPFSGQEVPRTAHNFIRGFLSLLSDGEERYRNLQQSGAIDRAFAWLNNEVERLNLSWEAIRELFLTAWRSLSIRDLANPIAAFRRMINLFRAPVGRILRFAAAVGIKILEFVFEGIMGAGGARVLAILRRAGDTFMTIIRNPVGFLRNLINAVVQGFRQFAANILRHLASGLVGWLFGALEGAGLQLPERFDLRGIISLVLQILGLTYARIRPRLVRLLGERTVSILERTFEFLRVLVTEGPAGAWRRIVEYAGNLRDRVMEGIRNWVITRVVVAAVTRLATMFNPVGAVLQAILAIYNTVMFFIERINQIMALVEAVTNSISNIAAGNISAAANYVEQTMARTLPLIISFLARLLGLGNISGAIRRIIQRIRRPIDRAIDRLVRWIARQARRLMRRARGLFERATGTAGLTAAQRLDRALTAAQRIVNRYAGRRVGRVVLRPLLAAIRLRYRLRTLEVVPRGRNWAVRGAASPDEERPTNAQVQDGEEEGALAAYRGIHFYPDWSEERYKQEVTRKARDIIGQPEFSGATQQVAERLSGPESPTVEQLEGAARIVQEEMRQLTSRPAEDPVEPPEQRVRRAAFTALSRRGIERPTDADFEAEMESQRRRLTRMRPIEMRRGGTRIRFANMFYVAINRYVDNMRLFLQELQNVRAGRYSGLQFTRLPFVSTSKRASAAARYALATHRPQRERRRMGIVGRLFVYLFRVSEQVRQGVLNIERLHREGRINRGQWRIREAEVAFTGSIPGENRVGYHDAQSSDSEAALGRRGEDTARDRAGAMGGLVEWAD